MPAMTNKAQVIIGGPEGQFDLLFPLTDGVVYYASVILLPEVRAWVSACAEHRFMQDASGVSGCPLLQAEAREFDADRALEYLHINAKNIDKRFNIPLVISKIGPTDIYAHRLADRCAC